MSEPKSAAAAARPAVAWPTGGRGFKVLRALNGISEGARGPDPVGFAEKLENVLRPPLPVRDLPWSDFFDERRSFEVVRLIDVVARAMTELISISVNVGGAIDGQLETLKSNSDVEIVPVRMAAEIVLGRSDLANVEGLARAFDTLRSLRPERVRRGRRGIDDAASRLVAVVVWYRQQHGLPARKGTSNWNAVRRPDHVPNSPWSDDEMKPKSETAELLCAARDAFDLQVSNRALARLLDRYIDKLVQEGREAGPEDWPMLSIGSQDVA